MCHSLKANKTLTPGYLVNTVTLSTVKNNIHNILTINGLQDVDTIHVDYHH